jgi:hypothetical protein
MEPRFIQKALGDISDIWKFSSIDHLANFSVPDSVLGRRRSLLKGDVNEQWARWFVESLVDPRLVALKKLTYPLLFAEVLNAVENRFGNAKTRPEKQEIASITAKIIFSLSEKLNVDRKRTSFEMYDRRLLLDIAGSPARCWICGAIFKEEAIENFLFLQKHKITLPPFVDLLKPRGLIERDYMIEIDHVVPFSKGGGESDNLELACGWCNRNKSAHMSIYDVEGQPRTAGVNALGIFTLPQPFWSVRLLALRRFCEHPDGCDKSVEGDEMTVVGIRKGGALNPSNIRITCYEHDPMGKDRLQPPSLVKKVWNY